MPLFKAVARGLGGGLTAKATGVILWYDYRIPWVVKRVRRKIAISVSAELLAAADALARETGESRSAVYERALRGYLAAREGKERSRRYVEGYRRTPETPREIAAALRAALPALTAEPWDEAG